MQTSAAATAIEHCLRAGTVEFVACGGARNAEMLAMLARAPGDITCWSHPEERSAGFFALGRARAGNRPVAVVTTSGTAASELLPALIEAHYQGVGLIALTADRPERFRGSGAPQAIEQVSLFGAYAATDPSGWRGDRPLHLNVPLEEPSAEGLSDAAFPRLRSGPAAAAPADPADTDRLNRFLSADGDLLVMLGCLSDASRSRVREFLVKLDAPVYAEATSGLREDPRLRHAAPELDAARVLRIGGVPACRAWRDLEERSSVEVFSVAPNALPGLARDTGVQVVPAVDWGAVETTARTSQPCAADERRADPKPEEGWIRRLSSTIPDGALVFLGNSLPIREWNRWAARRQRGLRCVANRGANGIDGLVSSFYGLAASESEAWLLIGDLSALYDLAAPWVLPQLPAGNRRIAVINNGGGRIFRQLPALAGAGARLRDLMENPHRVAFDGWARTWGMGYRRVEVFEDLDDLPGGDLVLEIMAG